tara:strand:- start:1607 stop:2068 length:462 start_codon:yes stop_codon:yes gene_type:complete
MSFIKLTTFIVFVFIVNCSGNKISNYHGSKALDAKFHEIKINNTNKNDLLKIFGQPSTKSDFNENKWFYFERIKTNQSLFKLGKQKIKKNNILIVEFNQKGILKEKKLLNLNDMNDVKFIKKTTEKEFSKNNIMYDVFSTLREKINAPLRRKN